MTYRRIATAATLTAAASLALAGVAAAQPAKAHKQVVQHVKLVVKSDDEHGKKGSDGKWHDAFLPASFKVKAGAKVLVSVVNYDDSAHSFHSKALHTNNIIMPGSEKGKVTKFTFTAPKTAGKYRWNCDPKCDPWAMKHIGFMRGYVTVVG